MTLDGESLLTLIYTKFEYTRKRQCHILPPTNARQTQNVSCPNPDYPLKPRRRFPVFREQNFQDVTSMALDVGLSSFLSKKHKDTARNDLVSTNTYLNRAKYVLYFATVFSLVNLSALNFRQRSDQQVTCAIAGLDTDDTWRSREDGQFLWCRKSCGLRKRNSAATPRVLVTKNCR